MPASRGCCQVCGKNYALKLVANRPVVRKHGTNGLPATRSPRCAGSSFPARAATR